MSSKIFALYEFNWLKMKQQEAVEVDNLPKKNRRCKYQKISEKLREQIIERLCVKKEGLREVAAKLKINHSTCKAIVKVFEAEGRIGKKKTRNRSIDVIETFTLCVVNKGAYEEIPEVKLVEKRVSCSRGDDINRILTEAAKAESEEIADDMLSSKRRFEEVWQQHLQAQLNYQMFNCQPLPNPMYLYGPQFQQGLAGQQPFAPVLGLDKGQSMPAHDAQ